MGFKFPMLAPDPVGNPPFPFPLNPIWPGNAGKWGRSPRFPIRPESGIWPNPESGKPPFPGPRSGRERESGSPGGGPGISGSEARGLTFLFLIHRRRRRRWPGQNWGPSPNCNFKLTRLPMIQCSVWSQLNTGIARSTLASRVSPPQPLGTQKKNPNGWGFRGTCRRERETPGTTTEARDALWKTS